MKPTLREEVTSKLNLTLACWNYDRTRAIQDGSVQPDGIDINYLDLPVEETFFRMVRFREFDVAEMSLSSYTVSLHRDPQPFVAIPVFPSRFFRHSCIFVSAKSNIREPKDLIGKKIGVPEFQMTAPVWIRGILDEFHGVPVDSVTYYTGGEEGGMEKQSINLRPGIKVEAIPDNKTLSQMLADGEIDALHSARSPSTLKQRSRAAPLSELSRGGTRLLPQDEDLPDHAHDRHPPRSLPEANRWIAQSLFKAFQIAAPHL